MCVSRGQFKIIKINHLLLFARAKDSILQCEHSYEKEWAWVREKLGESECVRCEREKECLGVHKCM